MIESITIITKGGLVLFTHTFAQVKGNPINALIKNVLLEDRVSEKSYHYNEIYTLKWALDNLNEVLFVVRWSLVVWKNAFFFVFFFNNIF